MNVKINGRGLEERPALGGGQGDALEKTAVAGLCKKPFIRAQAYRQATRFPLEAPDDFPKSRVAEAPQVRGARSNYLI